MIPPGVEWIDWTSGYRWRMGDHGRAVFLGAIPLPVVHTIHWMVGRTMRSRWTIGR